MESDLTPPVFITLHMKRYFFILAALLSPYLLWVQTNAEYKDVPSYHDMRDAIHYVTEEGIMSGYRDGQFFRPSQRVNRAEFTKVMMNLVYGEEDSQSCIGEYRARNWYYVTFPDVLMDEWYAPYVCLAIENGIINGYPDGSFAPEKEVTFVEAAKIITLTLQMPADEFGGDYEWYQPYVQALEERNAIPESIDAMNDPVTRAEVAEIVYRLENDLIDKPSKTYADLEMGMIAETPPDNKLVIESLGKEVPIISNVGGGELVAGDWKNLDQEIMTALRDGVVHYPGTAEPGMMGNVFIVGHSSFYANDPGKFKTVFADLANLKIGDTFTIYFNHGKYVYRIYEDKIIPSADTSVLEQPLDREIATLMTCHPPGTNLKRRVFIGERIE